MLNFDGIWKVGAPDITRHGCGTFKKGGYMFIARVDLLGHAGGNGRIFARIPLVVDPVYFVHSQGYGERIAQIPVLILVRVGNDPGRTFVLEIGIEVGICVIT